MIEIPEKLQRKEFRFCKVLKKSKRAFETGWQKDKNYTYDNQELLKWLKKGGNYGVLGGHGGLIIIDADKAELTEAVIKRLPITFSVISGSGNGRHFYFICNDLMKPIRLHDPTSVKGVGDVGDVQAIGKYVVGPNCIHPSGGTYKLIADSYIAEVSAEAIRLALKEWIKSNPIRTEEEKHSSIDDLNINVTDIVSTAGLKERGHEYQGCHPFHSSETGANFTIDPHKNCWHCFRHNTGGGPLSLLAVKENILSCEDCVTGTLRGEKFKEVLRIAKALFGKKKSNQNKGIPKAEIETEEFKMIIPKGNYIRDYFDYACELTDAYPEYHLQEALHQLSVATLGKAVVKIMPFCLKPNLYQQKTGTSTTSRKTTAGKISESIMQIAGMSEMKHPDSFSIEALMSCLCVKPIGYIRQSELGIFYKGIKRSYNIGSEEFFCNIYDNPEGFSRKLRREKIEIHNPYMTLIGGTTLSTFKSYVDNFESFLDSGFFARFLFTYPMRWKKRKRIGPISEEMGQKQLLLARRLEVIYDFFKYGGGTINFSLSKEGFEHFNGWQEKYEDYIYKSENAERESSFYNRAGDNALKIACLLEIGNIVERNSNSSKTLNNANNTLHKNNIDTIHNNNTYNNTNNNTCVRETPCDFVISVINIDTAIYYIQNLFIPHAKRVVKNVEILAGADDLRKVYEKIIKLSGRVNHTKLLRYCHMKLKEFREITKTLQHSGMIMIEGDPEIDKSKCFYTALSPDQEFKPPLIKVPAFTESWENGDEL